MTKLLVAELANADARFLANVALPDCSDCDIDPKNIAFFCPPVANMAFVQVLTKAPMPELWQMDIRALPEKYGISELWQMFC